MKKRNQYYEGYALLLSVILFCEIICIFIVNIGATKPREGLQANLPTKKQPCMTSRMHLFKAMSLHLYPLLHLKYLLYRFSNMLNNSLDAASLNEIKRNLILDIVIVMGILWNWLMVLNYLKLMNLFQSRSCMYRCPFK